jgi:uncharacterized repeat protein (TIGR01451 family)
VLEDRTVPAVFDLTSGTTSVTIDQAVFAHIANFPGGGNANSFLDIQSPVHTAEQGYNTNGVKQFDTKQTHAVRLNQIPTVSIGGVLYREFALDVSESNNQAHAYISVNEVRLYVAQTSTLTNYNSVTKTLGGVTAFYDMDSGGDNTVLLDGVGSGKIDMFLYVPDSRFVGNPSTTFVYLYSKMGDTFPGSAAFPGFEADSSAEHWDLGSGGPITPLADLSVAKTDFQTTAVPGSPITYTITVTNNGPTAVNQIQLTDTVPATLLDPQFQPATGSYDPVTHIWSGLNLAAGGSVAMSLSGTIDPAATGSITNTVTVATLGTVGETNLSNNRASDTDQLSPTGDLTIFKSDFVDTVNPGESYVYTIVVVNTGPSTAVNVPISDIFPALLSAHTWSTTTTGGAVSSVGSGTGDIIDAVTLPPGSSVTYSATATVDLNAPAGPFDNTATLTVPAGFTDTNALNNSSTHTDTVVPTALPSVDLVIQKTNNLSTVVPGSTITYTISWPTPVRTMWWAPR